jgi:hypothetical protein
VRFAYHAKDKNGNYVNGVVEALTKEEALEKIYAQGLSVISIEENRVEASRAGRPVSPVKLGAWIFIYDILCVGVLGFVINFGMSLGMGDSGIFYKLNPFNRVLVGFFNGLMGLGYMFGFIFLLIGGVGLLFNSGWARRTSIIGIWSCVMMAFGGTALAFTCALIQWGFGGDFTFIAIAAAAVAIPGIVMLRGLRKPFLEMKISKTALLRAVILIVAFVALVAIVCRLVSLYRHKRLDNKAVDRFGAARTR